MGSDLPRTILDQDLLDDYVLTRYWYGLNNNLHGGKTQIFTDADAANKQYQKVACAKSRNGYRMIYIRSDRQLNCWLILCSLQLILFPFLYTLKHTIQTT
jgi:predicted DNA-binding WGR domain protein